MEDISPIKEVNEYIEKEFPSGATDSEVKNQVEAFYTDVKDYVANFRAYFDSRAEKMGWEGEQKNMREEMFLNKLYTYCFSSSIRRMTEPGLGTGMAGSEIRKKAREESYINAAKELDDIFALAGLEGTFTVDDVRQIESQGTKTTAGAEIVMRKSLPTEISEDFYKMREIIELGTLSEGDKFIRILKGIYMSEISRV